jgi:hypothetical protein
VNDFEMVPVASVVTVINFVVKPNIHSISIVRSLYFEIFSDFLSIAFISSSLLLLLLLLLLFLI